MIGNMAHILRRQLFFGLYHQINDEALTLRLLSHKLGYSEFYTTRKFKEISGMQFRDYLRQRKLAFALKEVRDSNKNLLDIAFDYGFSSHEAFTKAFKGGYGIMDIGIFGVSRI